MPIERRDSGAQVRAILIALVSVAFAAMLGYALFRVATGQKVSVLAGSNNGEWNAGSTTSLAAAIERDGPILLSDVSGAGQRLPVFVSHRGSDPTTMWKAFEARPERAPASCFLAWVKARRRFVASCDGSTYPLDGAGLKQFATSVTTSGELIIDLKPDR